MKRKATLDILMKVADLQKQGLPNTVIATRLDMSVSTLRQALRRAATGEFEKSNKRGAESSDGWPSKLEKAVYQLLLLRERAKEITAIRRQVRVVLEWPGKDRFATKVDFAFTELKTGMEIYCEAKGMEDQRWRKIRRYWKQVGPAPLEVFKGTYLRPQLVETIIPERGCEK